MQVSRELLKASALRPSSLISFGLAIGCFAIWSGSSRLWHTQGWLLYSSPFGAVLLAAALVACALVLARGKRTELALDPGIFCLALAGVFFSDWLARGYNLLQGPSIRGEIMLLGAACLLIPRRHLPTFITGVAALSFVLLPACFFIQSEGRILFSDDNASFIYRLGLLRDNFPRIPFYSPAWNAGVDARDFFATGALNAFLIFFPLIKAFEVFSVYNVVVAGILFALLPLALYYSARLVGLDPRAAIICALLGISSGLLWYRWGLKYGTLGFITSASLLPLNLALLYRILARDIVIRWHDALLFVCSFSLMLLWSPSGITVVPLLLYAAYSLRRLMRKRFFPGICAALLLINLTWIPLFLHVSKVAKFVSSQSPKPLPHYMTIPEEKAVQAAEPTHFRQSRNPLSLTFALTAFQELAVSTNPVILFLFLPGLLLLAPSSRAAWAAILLWLIILGTVVPAIKPQLEFNRMLVLFSMCACVPAAAALQSLINRARLPQSKLPLRLGTALTLGFVLCAPFSAAALLRNRTIEQYHFAPPTLNSMAQAIQEFGGPGRVLFSGFVLHELGEGHLAPLVLLTSKPLMASSPMHDTWRYRQIFPKEFISRGRAGIEEYLDLFNVTAVLAHEREWRTFFQQVPEKYTLVWHSERFSMFRRQASSPSYFLRGEGELRQSKNSVTVRLRSDSAVIKFNYFPFLESTACKLKPHQVSDQISLIELSECPLGEDIVVRSKSPFHRLAELS